MRIGVVILAAGQGVRMRSELPKVLHPIAGQPMVLYGVQAAQALDVERIVLVVGHGAEQVRAVVGEGVSYALQEERLGTGHAVLQARPLLEGQVDAVLVFYADMPLLRVETLQKLIEAHREGRGPITMLAVMAEDPRGFGRVIRNAEGDVQAIVEEAAATPEQLAIQELNAGVYVFDAPWLWAHLEQIPLSEKGEYYLTDLIGMAVDEGRRVFAVVSSDEEELLGVNTRVHLAQAEAAMRRRINERWMLAGVTIVDPASTYIDVGVELARDVRVEPNTYLRGATRVGEGCVLGPNTVVVDSVIGARCRVMASVLEGATLEEEVSVGPFAHLREGAYLERGVHMGNFGEVKNARLGAGTRMGHVGYIGDAEIGPGVNIGAGTITCNYDGERKHRTVVEEGAFLGSDTLLVAPVRVGAYAVTGAGAVVTRDVPPHAVAYGVPARVHGFRKREAGGNE